LVLSLSGGLAGVLVAAWMLSGLIALRPDALSRIDLTRLDGRVLLFTTVTAVVWGVLFSLAPYSQVFRTNVQGVLHTGSRSMGTRRGYRARAGLVVAQVGISTILLITAGLLARGFYELRQVNLGFNDSNTLTFKVSLAGRRSQGPEHVGAFSRQLRERLAAIPGVTAVGAVSHLPYDTVPNWGTPYLPEHETDPTETGIADARAVTPGYFDAIGAELIEGRWFSDFDTSSSMPVAIIDSVFARRLWPEGGALGKRLKADPGTTGSPNVTVTVVGVVRHLRHREMTTDLREQMYFPATQSFRNPMAYVVRSATHDPDMAAEARSVMQEIDPTLPLYDVRPLAAYTSEARATRFFTLVIAIAFAGSALALTLIGIYGVTALAVAQRRGEFAVRLALGARHGQVAALVVKNGIALALVGAVAGGLATVAVARMLRTQLYTVSPADPSTYIGGLAAVLLAAALASAVPAYRAARSNPLDSLRTQ
jgi:predicted permease